MPITITLPPPGTSVGPGYVIQLSSDFVGPLPLGTQFEVRISTHPEGTPNVIWQFIPTQQPTVAIFVADRFTTSAQNGAESVPAGSSVHVIAELKTNDQTVIDSGRVDATYDPTTMMWQHINQNTGTGSGGLTAEQAAQLQRTDTNTQEIDVNWQTYTSVTLPSLQLVLDGITQGITATLQDGANAVQHTIGDLLSWVDMHVFPEQDLSGGTICEPFRYDASLQNLQSLSVFIDVYPPEFRLVTPDAGWSFRDFAVLTFLRGNSIIERHGIHTLSYTVSRLPQSIGPWPLNIRFDVQPTDYHIHVDWAPGVCGHIRASVRP